MKRTVLVIMLSVLLVIMLGFTFNIQPVEATGTISIRADGSVDPPTAPIQRDGEVYTFTDNINDSIVIERDNIVVEGNGFTISGTGRGKGISLSGRSNVTVKNMGIMAFRYGIHLDLSSKSTLLGNNITANKGYAIWSSDFNGFWNNSIVGNNITNNGGGIRLRYPSSHNNISDNRITANNWTGILLADSKHNILSGNNITANKGFGIWLSGGSSNTTLRNNSMAKNEYNFKVDVWPFGFFMNDVDVSNIVDGRPVYYWISKRDMAVPLNAGYLALINCSNITVRNLNLTNNGDGLLLARTENSTITQNNIANNLEGIYLSSSSNINISYNTMVNNFDAIYIKGSSTNNSISYNNITDGGVLLSHVSGNLISHNNITRGSILLSSSSNNDISYNNLTNEGSIGLVFSSDNNNIFYNNLTNGGILLGYSSKNNKISHNNIVANNYEGVSLSYSSNNNTITYNNITNGFVGLDLSYSSNYNNISHNNVANNRYAIWLAYWCSNNVFYHNNFLNNTFSVDTFRSGSNVWDAGYPSGGNYWSGYTNVDLYSGPFQNETGSDGIWDHPYAIDASNQDNYPLVEPWGSLPKTIGELKTEMERLRLEGEIDNRGIAKSLTAKLNAAQKLIDKGKADEARMVLKDFITQVQELSEIHITAEATDILIKSTEHILSTFDL